MCDLGAIKLLDTPHESGDLEDQNAPPISHHSPRFPSLSLSPKGMREVGSKDNCDAYLQFLFMVLASFCRVPEIASSEDMLSKASLCRPYTPSALFFKYNTALGSPYRVIVDTNFINFSIQNKLDLEEGMKVCLYAKCTPCITDCVMAELEKLGQKYHVALRIAKDPQFEKLPCTHKGTYADDCIVDKVTQYKCYIVATCDRDLKRRIRKIPGVPIMYITQHRYSVELLPEATIGGAPRI